MPAPIQDRLGEKGGKHSLWISASDYRRLVDTGRTAGEVFRRGLDTMPDPVTVTPELEPALELVARLAQALASGGKVVYGTSPASEQELPSWAAQSQDAVLEAAAAIAGRSGYRSESLTLQALARRLRAGGKLAAAEQVLPEQDAYPGADSAELCEPGTGFAAQTGLTADGSVTYSSGAAPLSRTGEF